MKIGIIGSGDVGRALALGFIKNGYEAKIGSRSPAKLNELMQGTKDLTSGTFEETAQFGEIIVLATNWIGTENALKLSGTENLKGKIVIDVTNPLDFSHGMPPSLAVGFNNSGGEIVQSLLPDSHVVKTLNIIGNGHMVNPHFAEGTPTMLLCGNTIEAKKTVRGILEEFGWKDIVDLGKIENSRLMEPLCILWVTYGSINNSWNHAFSILKR